VRACDVPARGTAISPLEFLHYPRWNLCKIPAEPGQFILTGDPLLLGVIVATGYGYRREDGVAVIPIGALGP
jgi:hypothetical protein